MVILLDWTVGVRDAGGVTDGIGPEPRDSIGLRGPGGDGRALATLGLGVVAIAWAPIFFRLSEVGPLATAFWRVALAWPLLLAWQAASRRDGRPATGGRPDFRARVGLVAAGAFFAGDLMFWHWSLTYTSVANATLFANAAPIFVALAGWLLLGRRFSGRFLLGLATAIAGAGILMGSSVRLGPANLFGDLLGVVTALFLAGYLLVVERLRAVHPTATIMVWNAGAGAVLLLPLALAVEGDILPPGWTGWAVLLGLAVVSHAGGQSLIAQAMARLPAAFTSVSLLLQPLLAAVFAWAVLGEPLGLQQGVGGAVILAGILLARSGSR